MSWSVVYQMHCEMWSLFCALDYVDIRKANCAMYDVLWCAMVDMISYDDICTDLLWLIWFDNVMCNIEYL